jgi:shikimate dehydrogenase
LSKKHYAVIGHPIGHTMSPFIHKRLFALAGVDAEYEVLDIAPELLHAQFSMLKNLSGYNITIPHKRGIIPLLDGLSKRAALFGSVNTVQNGERCMGYTTDPDGFLMALKSAGIPLAGRVVILGTGGVARTMAYEAAIAGCSTVIAVRPSDLSNVASLAGEIRTSILHAEIETCRIDRIAGPIDLLINATPVGMYPAVEAAPVGEDVLKNCGAVFDAVYNPLDTLLLKTARGLGCKTLGGMSMLVWQAVAAHQIWDGSSYDPADIEALCTDAEEELRRVFPERLA